MQSEVKANREVTGTRAKMTRAKYLLSVVVLVSSVLIDGESLHATVFNSERSEVPTRDANETAMASLSF